MAVNLKDKTYAQIILGIQGAPGTFKTGASLTFPNPLVIDIDNGLTYYAGKDIRVMPVYDHEWCSNYKDGKFKPRKTGQPPDRMSIIEDILLTEAMQLDSNQTVVVDSWSALQDAFDQEHSLPHRVASRMTRTGEEDKFKFWDEKIKYSKRILSLCRSLKSHAIVTFHEVQVRNPDTGMLMDKVAPLMQGKFVAELKRFFTDWFRATSEEVKDAKGKVVSTQFFWQLRSDNQFDAKTRLVIPEGVHKDEPNFSIFSKYGYRT